MEIKDGQVWKTRDGTIAAIENRLGGNPYPWWGYLGGQQGHSWTTEGEYDTETPNHPKDLVKLVQGVPVQGEKLALVEIEVGQIWEDKAGTHWRILAIKDHPGFPVYAITVETGEEETFTLSGRWREIERSKRDLVKLVQEVPAQGEKENMMEIREGQVWETRDGTIATINSRRGCSPYLWRGTICGQQDHSWTVEGRYDIVTPNHPKDLVKLIKDSSTQCAVAATSTKETPMTLMQTVAATTGNVITANTDAIKEAAKRHAAKEALALVAIGVNKMPMPDEVKAIINTPLGTLAVLQVLVAYAGTTNNERVKGVSQALLTQQYTEVMGEFLPSIADIVKALEGINL